MEGKVKAADDLMAKGQRQLVDKVKELEAAEKIQIDVRGKLAGAIKEGEETEGKFKAESSAAASREEVRSSEEQSD